MCGLCYDDDDDGGGDNDECPLCSNSIILPYAVIQKCCGLVSYDKP